MITVGLTGSIAVGKSTVCQFLKEFGCQVLDADRVARDVVAPGSLGLKRIVSHFGGRVLRKDGSLDRPALAGIIFFDEKEREALNSIVHPLVIEAQNEWLNETQAVEPDAIAVIDAALMIESGGYKRFNKLVVVWCNADIQLQRLIERDGLSPKEAEARIAAQMPQEEKKKYADLLIDTSAGFEETRAQTLNVYEQLRKFTR
ncbi:dephospho-CoA kinase [Leptolyngbya sp. 7M]|uniref:dephospho-CoA kinase n=1 Tax=Leptolyngbya sp. 7M TaxID=2812896 RepID=UPI001B8D51C3|nr:dephospho-CoA kinase [Leptolyngbya sp. 7M]QYO65458.1 dephospho-CoA kinase [Leptolyngbya sp. 7M]